ncbi:hypothetical protein FQN57_003965 [Myotisia sp. PD_48]|nr:hypothetical protein FQN57_003965 [Myotisia sp. PD_48]
MPDGGGIHKFAFLTPCSSPTILDLASCVAKYQKRLKLINIPTDLTMAITELALLHLNKPVGSDEELSLALRDAKLAMEAFTGYPFSFLIQQEDPSFVYVLGTWESLTQHVDDWIPSDENQAILKLIEGKVEVEWLIHLDIDPTESLQASQAGFSLVDAPAMVIVRHFVNSGKTNKFINGFTSGTDTRKDVTVPFYLRSSRRIDIETKDGHGPGEQELPRKEKEEFVSFFTWQGLVNFPMLSETEGFEKYERVVEFLDGFDVKHVKKWEL